MLSPFRQSIKLLCLLCCLVCLVAAAQGTTPAIEKATIVIDPVTGDKFFNPPPPSLLLNRSDLEKSALLNKWRTLSNDTKISIRRYEECRELLPDLKSELQLLEKDVESKKAEVQATATTLKKLLLKALGRLGLQTGVVIGDAATDFQLAIKKIKKTMASSGDDIKAAQAKAELIADFDNWLQALKRQRDQMRVLRQNILGIEEQIYTAEIIFKRDFLNQNLTPIDKSTPSKYLREDPQNPNMFAAGEVATGGNYHPKGELLLNIRNRYPGGEAHGMVLRGKEEFSRILKHFDGKFGPIRGVWIFGDNLAAFNRSYFREGMTLEQAAFSTWTGRMAKKSGYTRAFIMVNELAESGNYFTRVEVRFVKP